jgi:hypothetical protein
MYTYLDFRDIGLVVLPQPKCRMHPRKVCPHLSKVVSNSLVAARHLTLNHLLSQQRASVLILIPLRGELVVPEKQKKLFLSFVARYF